MKKRISKNMSLLSLSLLMSLSLIGCGNTETTSESKDTAGETTADSSNASDKTSESITDVTPEVTSKKSVELEWGEELDLKSLFEIKAGNFTFDVKDEWLSGEVNNKLEGEYTITLSADVTFEGITTHLDSTCTVNVITKVEISTPKTDNPVYVDSNNAHASITSDTLLSLFTVKLNGIEVETDPDWISGVVGTEYGKTYPVTLTLPVNGKEYTKVVNVHYANHAESVSTEYDESNPYEIKKNATSASEFDFAKLFKAYSTGVNLMTIVDSDKATGEENTEVNVVATIDKTQVDFTKVGTYPVSMTCKILGSTNKATAYVSVVPSAVITDSETVNYATQGTEKFDFTTLFSVTDNGEEVESDKLTIVEDVHFNRPGNYVVKAIYDDCTYTRNFVVLSNEFFGTYNEAEVSVTATGVSTNNIVFNEDGTIVLSYKRNSTDTSDSIYKGNLAFDHNGVGILSLTGVDAEENPTGSAFKMEFDYIDGLLYTHLDEGGLNTQATIKASLMFFYKTSYYTYEGYYAPTVKTGVTNVYDSNQIMDFLTFTDKNDKLQVVGIYHDIITSTTAYYDIIKIYTGVEYTEYDSDVQLTVSGLGSFLYTVTTSEEGKNTYAYYAYVGEGKTSSLTLGINNVELTNAADSEKKLTFSLTTDLYTDGDIYTVSGTEVADYSNKSSRLVAYDDKTGVGTFALKLANTDTSTSYLKYELIYVDVNVNQKTYTVKDYEKGAWDGYYANAGVLGTQTGLFVTIAGDYAIVDQSVYSYFDSGLMGKVSYPSENEIKIEMLSDRNHSIKTGDYVLLRATDDGNRLVVEHDDCITMSQGPAETFLSGELRGIGTLYGKSYSLAAGTSVLPVATDLFDGKKLGSEGQVVSMVSSDIHLIDLDQVDANTPGAYTVHGSYTSGSKTIYASSVVLVKDESFGDTDVVGEYSGYISGGSYQGEISVNVDSTGMLTCSRGGSEVFTSQLQETEKDNEYAITYNYTSQTIKFKDGVLYFKTEITNNTCFFMAISSTNLNGKALSTTDSVIPLCKGAFIDRFTNTAMILSFKDADGNIDSYYLSDTYQGKVTFKEETGVTLPSYKNLKLQSKNKKGNFSGTAQYFVYGENGKALCRVRYYVYDNYKTKPTNSQYRSFLLESDSHVTDQAFKDLDEATYSFDGFGTCVYSDGLDTLSCTYTFGFDNKFIIFDSDGNEVSERQLGETEVLDIEEDSLKGHKFLLRADLNKTGTTNHGARIATELSFDGKGFARLTSPYTTTSFLVPYKATDSGVSLLGADGETVLSFTKSGDISYIFDSKGDITLGTKYYSYSSTDYDLVIMNGATLIDVTNE